jgi:lipopolysaccharide transport system permease protein
MSASYSNTDAQPGHVEFDIRNDSDETWRAADGFGIGYQLFDADTGTLIVDGPRMHPDRDVKPGETAHVRLELERPEDGRYYTIVSPMREHVCWYWDQGWPFLLIDSRVRVVTKATLRRERLWRGVGRALVYPVLTIWRNRGLIRVMTRRDVLGRYRGSFGGSFWTVFNPLLLMLTYYFVFAVVLGTRFPGDPSRSGFALYYLAGMLPWLAFSEAVGRSATVMLDHRNFVKKLVFAVETLPVNLVAAGLVTECVAIVLFCGMLLIAGRTFPVTILWLPLLLIPQVLFTAGLSWFLAGLGVFVRDLGQILGFLLTIWFFATPICYPETQLPAVAAQFLTKNPIFVLVRGYRAILLDHQAPAFGALWKFWLLSAIVFVLGHAWFYKLRKSFADMM